MHSYFELFDLRSGNVITDFACERDAWGWLRQAATEFGLEELNDLALSHMQNGHPTLIAMDEALVRRVAGEIDQAGNDVSSHPSNKRGSVAS